MLPSKPGANRTGLGPPPIVTPPLNGSLSMYVQMVAPVVADRAEIVVLCWTFGKSTRLAPDETQPDFVVSEHFAVAFSGWLCAATYTTASCASNAWPFSMK